MLFELSASFDDTRGEINLDCVSRDNISAESSAAESYSIPLLLFFTSLCRSLGPESDVENFTFPGRASGGDEQLSREAAAEVRKRLDQLHRNAKKETGGNARRGRVKRAAAAGKEPHWALHFLWFQKDGKQVPVFKFPRGKSGVGLGKDVGKPEVVIRFGGRQLAGDEQLGAFIRLLVLLWNPTERAHLCHRGVRENLRYNVIFTDSAQRDGLDERFLGLGYQHYKAHITFDRISPRRLDTFRIGLNNTGSDLGASIARPGVIYREVFDLLPDDLGAFTALMSAATAAAPKDRSAALDRVFRVAARVNGEPAPLELVTAEHSVYYLEFKLPDASHGLLFLRFDLELFGFQRRSLYRFPIVVSEPSRNAQFTFNFAGATVENADCFVGCAVTPEGLRATGSIDHANRVFWLKRGEGEFFNPGEGAAVFWTPPQRVDRVELVELAREDHRLVIDARYATDDNFMGRRLYPSPRLFLVRQTARKLAVAQDRLSEKRPGLRLKVWDAYRPMSVQRQMWTVQSKENYVADPAKGSVHNRGCAVDVTLADADGNDLAMPTEYDDFSEAACPETIRAQTTTEAENFRVLRECMESAGFEVLPSEWWHFNDSDWRRYPVLDIDSPEQGATQESGLDRSATGPGQ